VKIAAGDRDERDAWCERSRQDHRSLRWSSAVGNVATLFKPRKKDPGIVLPR